jgi:hypothetical protein
MSLDRRPGLTTMSPADRSPALAALDVLVGGWTVRPTPPPSWGVTGPLEGTATFEWALGGAYLLWTSHAPDPIPDSISLLAPEGEGYRQHYYDSRGVTRLFRMTLVENVWTLLRTEPDFSPLDFAQRFVAEIGPTTIDGRWEQSHDGGRTWDLDFAIAYVRDGVSSELRG